MTILDKLVTRVQKISLNETERAQLVDLTKKDLTRINELAGILVDKSIENIKLIYEILSISENADRRLLEYDPGETADKLKDLQLVFNHIEMLLGIEHLNLATRLEIADENTIELAILELKHTENGDAKISLLKQLTNEQ